VLFLDADDILKPIAIENCLAAFRQNPDVAFVYGGFCWVNSERGLISEAMAPTQPLNFAALLSKKWALMHDAIMYNGKILQLVGGFDETLLHGCEDYDVYLRLAKNYPIAPCKGIIAEYRLHGENMTRNAARMLKVVRTVLARHTPTAEPSRELRIAYAEGVRHWSGLWGARVERSLIEELKGRRRPSVLASLMATGLRYDPNFAGRLSRRVLRKATAIFGKIGKICRRSVARSLRS
jgi:hypothetical protein